MLGMDGRGLDLTSMADIPAGTGVGVVGEVSLTALLKALRTRRKGNLVHLKPELAAQA